MSDFDRALPIVLHVEGGFVDDPDDRGGRTNMGVTQGTYDAYRVSQGLPVADVLHITNEEVADIYRTRYWDEVGADTLAWPVNLILFDMAVNHGPVSAKRLMQMALDVKADGVVGPVTLNAVYAAQVDSLANEMLWQRVEKYRRIARGNQQKFLPGWLWRVAHLREAAGLEGVEQAVAEED